jgi:phosphotransferase system, enzyme I, PtsP
MRADLREILDEVATASDLDEALAITVRRVKSALSVDACAIYLTGPESDQLARFSSSGSQAASPEPVPGSHLAGLLALVVQRRELVVVADATDGPRDFPASDTAATRHDTFLGMPLIHGHRVLGVLAAWKGAGQFDRDEVSFFVSIAAQLAERIDEAAAIGEVAGLLRGEVQGAAVIRGVQAAAGLTVGIAAWLDPLDSLESIPDRRVEDFETEETAFRNAVAAAQAELRAGSQRLKDTIPSEVRELFDVYAMLLGSDELVRDTIERIRAGSWAPGAWRETIAEHARVFDRMADPYLRARGDDIREIGQRILLHLQSRIDEGRSYPERTVLIGDRVSIAEIAAVPVGRLAGIVFRLVQLCPTRLCSPEPWEFPPS